ncbi:MAG: hypothetical protein NUV65_04630 [Candidatus Roizmanbacteria bacterium]|nr:hypothetical protein [Candidatus Roizmanbacteria bacterium]
MTLSELSYNVRTYGKVAGIFFVFVIIFYAVIVLVLSSTGKNSNVPEANGLNPKFGSIQKVVFEEPLQTEKLSFVLDTIDGAYPSATSSASVYYVKLPDITLVYLKRVEQIAKNFGFDVEKTPYTRIDDAWVKYESDMAVLNINTRTFHYFFTLKPANKLQELLSASSSADIATAQDTLTNRATSALSSQDSYPENIATGKKNMVYLRYDYATLSWVPAPDSEVPQAVRIDYFRQDAQLPFVSPRFFSSQNYVILAPVGPEGETAEMSYKNFTTIDDGGSFYPLISPTDAWKRLEEGKVTTVFLAPEHTLPIKIRDFYLAYYDPESYQEYIQPIFVFLGSDNYVGYTPAVKDEYLLDNTTQSPTP